MRRILFWGLVLSLNLIFISCKTTSVSVEVLKPAQISVPPGIKSLALVNRSSPTKKERNKNILEGIITGEVPFVDKRAAEECVKGVLNRLDGSPRFTALIPGGIELKGTGTREFPEALDWEKVERICKQNNADALVVLEVFDSDNIYEMTQREAKRKENNVEITYTEYVASLRVQIEAGWRIYYPAQKRIIDQNIYSDAKRWTNASDAKKKAQAGLIPIENAVAEAGYFAGQQYAKRISPLWMWVSRMYYKKGNDDFKKATRRAQVNDWKGAAELWKKYVKSSNSKIAGYATYNMALACEMEGDLDAALDWAKKSYADYGNNKARYYMNALQIRINDQIRLQEQMEGAQ
jgi:hypothetical protein